MAEATLHQGDPDVIDYVPGAAIAAGQVVIAGSLVGVAMEPIANGVLGSIRVSGVFDVAKTASVTFAVGAPVYFNEAANTAGSTNTHALIGYAVKAALAGDATVRVLLANPIDPTDA